nr:uncharacterized protein LOC110081014 isoform X2 [Pogona vitticeps]
MGHSASKEIRIPPEGTPASYMYHRYGPHTCQFLEKWNSYTESYPLKEFPLEGTFEMDKIDHLRRVLQHRRRKVSSNQWVTYFAWYEETSTRLRQSEIRCVHDSQEKLQAEIKELKREVSLDRKERLNSAQVRPSLGSEDKVRDNPAHSSDAAMASLPEVQENSSTSRPRRSAPDHPPRMEEAEQSRPTEQLGAQPKADMPLMLAPTPDVGLAPAQPPWTPTELYQLVLRLLEIKEDPEKFKEQLRIVLACFKPTWAQAQQLLGALLEWDVQKRLFEEASWPMEDPGWSEQELVDPHRRLLEAVSKVCPRKCDWSKILACKQKKGEEPADYMERLLEMTRRYIGFDEPIHAIEGLIGGWFVDGLHWEVRNRLKQVSPGWREQNLRELLDLADSCWAKKQRREETLEREFMALRLRELRATVHGGGRGRMVEGRRGYGAIHAVHTENYMAIDYGCD